MSFIAFREDFNLDGSWPASSHDVLAYIAYQSSQSRAPSTICTYLAAISFVHKINGWLDPTNSFIVKKMKEGCKRQDIRSDSRRPITYIILRQLVSILPSVCSSSFEAALFKAAFSLCFFGFLRVGEFASYSKSADTSRLISFSDVSLSDNRLRVIIRFSKTDQVGVSTSLIFTRASDASVCPVIAIAEFLSVRGCFAGPLFTHFNREPLTRSQFAYIMREGIRVLGLPTDGFTPHSFRIGAATSAALCGIPDAEIQALGRWKSSAFKRYIRPNLLDSRF